jgi:hypothetical protein
MRLRRSARNAGLDASGILSKSGVKFLKKRSVEPLWNTARRKHWLDGRKKISRNEFSRASFASRRAAPLWTAHPETPDDF